jgi:predicted Fe-S protein YdhL (DUF1289 family)
MDPETALCQGCQRTIDEIQAWPDLNNTQKLLIWRLVRQRRSAAN